MSNAQRQVIAMGTGIGLGGGLGLVLFILLGWAVALGLVAGAAMGGVTGLLLAPLFSNSGRSGERGGPT